MDLNEAVAEVNQIRQKVLLAKQGSGAMPSEDEIKRVLSELRGARRSAAEAGTTRKKAKVAPADLTKIFAQLPGMPKAEG